MHIRLGFCDAHCLAASRCGWAFCVSRRRVESPRNCSSSRSSSSHSSYKYLLSRACNLSRAHETHSHRAKSTSCLEKFNDSLSTPLPPLTFPHLVLTFWIFAAKGALTNLKFSTFQQSQRAGRSSKPLYALRGRCQFNCQLAVKSNKARTARSVGAEGAILLSSTDQADCRLSLSLSLLLTRSGHKFLLKFWQMLWEVFRCLFCPLECTSHAFSSLLFFFGSDNKSKTRLPGGH